MDNRAVGTQQKSKGGNKDGEDGLGALLGDGGPGWAMLNYVESSWRRRI